MARTFHAYLEPARVPARADLQSAIKRLGFDLTLDHAYAPFETSGYLPCTLEGEDAGVDVRFEREAALPDAAAALADQRGPRTALIKLKWGGDVREQLSALIVAGALADGFGAWLIEPDQGQVAEGDALLKTARKLHSENF